jgi:hypothetical protein
MERIMTAISSVSSSSYTPPPVPQSAPSALGVSSSPSTSQYSPPPSDASASPDAGAGAIYTAVGSASTSNIRGANVNTSA